jgi:type II secretory pathway predicted ATPase ExeA
MKTECQVPAPAVLARSSQLAGSSDTFGTGTDLERIFRNAGATKLERHLSHLEKAQISARIKQAREMAGLTQDELGDLLEPRVKQRTIANYESIRVPWDYLHQIAEHTGRTWEWLVYGEQTSPAEIAALLEAMAQIQDAVEEILRRLPAAPEAGSGHA